MTRTDKAGSQQWTAVSLLLELVSTVKPPGGGGGVLPEKLGGGVRPSSQNPYPIYDQNLRYSLPFYDLTKNLKPNLKILFQTCILMSSVVQTNFKHVKLP